MPIGEAIAAGKALVEASKLVTDLINRPDTDPQQVRARLHEMLVHLVNAQTGLSEAQQEIMELRSQLDNREAFKALQEDMEFVLDGHFYVKKSERAKGLIPYCPACWKSTGKDIHITPTSGPGAFTCTIHHTSYVTKEYEEWKLKADALTAQYEEERLLRFKLESQISPI